MDEDSDIVGSLADDYIRRLSEAAFGRSATMGQVKVWAFEHIEIPWEKIDCDGVPHPGAPRYLAWLRTAEGQKAFFSQMARRDEHATRSGAEQDDEERHERLISLTDVLIEERQNAERAPGANPYTSAASGS
jgi:hypothetical protein